MQYRKTTLDNGLRVITAPMKESQTVTVLVLVTTGSEYETKEINGLSHFLEHMCFKGTAKRPSALTISKELDSIGAESNAFTSQEYTGYYAKANPKHVHKIVDILSDIYLNPTFNEAEIEKEKGVIVQEIMMYEDMPHRHVGDVFSELMYGDQPAGWNIAGTPEIVKSMTKEHFVEYRKKHYVAKKTLVAVAGNFDENLVLEEIKQAFSMIEDSEALQKKPVVEEQKEPRIKIKNKKTDQVHLVLGVRSFDIKNENIASLKVLGTILGKGMSSRLFQKMREDLGICYYVRAGSDEFTDHGHFEVMAGVDKARVAVAVEAIMNELKQISETLVMAEELEKAKEYMVSGMSMGLETSDSVSEFLIFQEALKGEILTPEQTEQKIRAVTAEDVQRIARTIFKNESLNLAIVGDISNEDELKKVLKF